MSLFLILLTSLRNLEAIYTIIANPKLPIHCVKCSTLYHAHYFYTPSGVHGGGWENPLVHSTTYIRRALLCTNILESSAFFSAYMQCYFHNQNTSSVVSAWIVCKPCRCTSTALSVHNSTTTTFTHAKHK